MIMTWVLHDIIISYIEGSEQNKCVLKILRIEWYNGIKIEELFIVNGAKRLISGQVDNDGLYKWGVSWSILVIGSMTMKNIHSKILRESLISWGE